MSKATPQHYVDNVAFYNAIKKYRKACEAVTTHNESAPKRKKSIPPMPEYIGECILLIAQHVSRMWQFSGYSFREDMISDAAENCVRYIHKFDPEKSKNPFAYFTLTIYRAFVRMIVREKDNSYRKYKFAIHQASSQPMYTDHEHDVPSRRMSHDRKNSPASFASYENIQQFVADYETKKEAQSQLKKRTGAKKGGAKSSPKKKPTTIIRKGVKRPRRKNTAASEYVSPFDDVVSTPSAYEDTYTEDTSRDESWDDRQCAEHEVEEL